MDASYGNNSKLRQDLTGLGLSYVAAIMPTVKVRPLREDDPKPPRVSVKALALSLPKRAWRTVTWREGTNAKLRSRFARVRVRAAPIRGEARFAEETLLIEWPKGEAAPTKFWLTTIDPDMPLRRLVDLASCAGASSAIMRTSSRKSALGIMRAAAGAASIIMAHSQSQPTVS